jgi:hypothetical protein
LAALARVRESPWVGSFALVVAIAAFGLVEWGASPAQRLEEDVLPAVRAVMDLYRDAALAREGVLIAVT